MRRSGFLRALAGLGFVAVMPKLNDEEEEGQFTVTSENGKTAWNQNGQLVYQEDWSSEPSLYKLMSSDPIDGDMWYDSKNNSLFINRNNKWYSPEVS